MRKIAIFVLSCLLSWPATAYCDSWTAIKDYLENRHQEDRIFEAVTSDGRRLEFWLNGERRWTVVIVASDLACMALHGNSFNVIRDATYGDPIEWPRSPTSGR